MRCVKCCSFIALCMTPLLALAAAPTISSDSGTWVHGGQITLTVTNAGSKAQAAPRVWDNGVGTGEVANNPNGIWTRGIPDGNTGSQTQYNLAYHTVPFRGIFGPHSEDGGLIAGAHDDRGGAYGGNDVIMCKTVPANPGDYVYARWYTQHDPNWCYCGQSCGATGCGTPDNNTKMFDWSRIGYYDSQDNWYTELHPKPSSCTSGTNWNLNDNGAQAEVTGGANATNPCNRWVLIEHLVQVSNVSNGGAVEIWDNGVRRLNNSATQTQDWNTGSVSVCIGGYSRASSPDNWRYFDDLWIDNTRAMVMLCDQPSISNFWGSDHGTCHPQPATAWSNNSITITVNRAGMSGTKYVYVFNDNGEHNTQGYPITLGGSGSPPQCSDSLDNDGDGDVDLADSGCSSANDTSEAQCGDGFLDAGEDCDGSQLGGETCASQGYALGGTLGCTAQCSFDVSQCTVDTTTLRVENSTTVSDVDPNATTYTFSHSITYPSERGIVVLVAGLGNAATSACHVTGVTYDGAPLTQAVAVADGGAPNFIHASIWYRYAPSNTGANTVAITFNNDLCNSVFATASTLANVNSTMLDEAGSDNEFSGGGAVSWSTSNLGTNSLCLDAAVLDAATGLTPVSTGMTTLLSQFDTRMTYGSFTGSFNGGWNATNNQGGSGLPGWIYAAACFNQKGGSPPPPAVCGNNIVESGEVCDGTALNGETCGTQGFAGGGTLACQPNCAGYDVSNCTQGPLGTVPNLRRDDDQ